MFKLSQLPCRLAILILGIAIVTPSHALAQTADELEIIKIVFEDLQQRSFARNAEYCGYIGYQNADELMVSVITPGDTTGCSPVWPNDFDPVASFHTHGGFDERSWSEIPSVDDIEADADEDVDGWVATPGGRLWFLDTEDMTVRLVCGLGCLLQDPRFQREKEIAIDDFYTYEELIELEEENP
ncbi:MAG: DUF4329 domain-containing protein [Devosiaceae bacterium]